MTTSIKHWIIAAAAVLAGSVNVGCYGPDKELEGQLPRVLKLSGDTTLDAELQGWAGRWTDATGIPVTFGDRGAPVAFVPELADRGIENMCGETIHGLTRTAEWVRSMKIDPDPDPVKGCPSVHFTVGHEIGHVIGGVAAQHATSGVFVNSPETWPAAVIDEATLEAVCAATDCSAFDPETYPE